MEQNKQEDKTISVEKLKEDLEELLGLAKSGTEKINELSIGISTKAEEIELYYETYKDTRSKFDDSQTGVRALLDQSTNLKNQIQQLSESAQAQGDQVTAKINELQVKIGEIETYYGAFSDLRLRLDDSQTGLQALLTQATGVKDAIGLLAVSAQAHLDQITAGTTAITTKIQEIESYYTKSFTPLKAQVDDPKNGIQATLGIVTGLKNEIVKTKAGADEDTRQIKSLREQSDKLKQESESLNKDIKSLKEQSKEFKDSIGETLDLVTASSLTDSFVKRRDTISSNVKFWKWSTLLSVIALAGSVLYIYYLQSKATDGFRDWHSWYRYLFTSPLIYLVYLCSHNYNIERDYEERYAFKTVLSTSLQAYIKLLSDKFSDKKDDLLKFTLASIDRIYEEPYASKDETQEMYGGFKNIFNFGVKNNSTKSHEASDAGVSGNTKEGGI